MDRSQECILHVAWLKASYGGAHKYLDRLAQRLLQRGWRVAVAVNQQAVPRPFLDDLQRQGAEVVMLPLAESAAQSAVIIDNLVRSLGPKVVHFNSGARQPRAMAQQMTSWRAGDFSSVFTMHLPLVSDRPSWGQRVQSALPLPYGPTPLREKTAFARRFDRIISVSERFASINQAALKLPAQQLVTIPNGVDTAHFAPQVGASCPSGDGPVVIGGCGALVAQKRFDLLIEAAGKLQRGRFRIVIAGDGPERQRLQRLIHQWELTDCVQLAGHQVDVPTFLRGLDVFVMSSDYEAFPYSQLEAMATGLPSVVTDVGDLPLMARDGIESVVVPPGDADALAVALAGLILSPSKRTVLAQAARRRVRESYEQANCEAETLKLIDSLLIQRRRNSLHIAS